MSNQNQPLTREVVMKIATAINRLHALNQQKLATPDSDAEKDSLSNYVAAGLTHHAAEFINAWLCVADEYSPLVSAFSSLQLRAANMARARAELLAQTQPPAKDEGNIIVPPEFNREAAPSKE